MFEACRWSRVDGQLVVNDLLKQVGRPGLYFLVCGLGGLTT